MIYQSSTVHSLKMARFIQHSERQKMWRYYRTDDDQARWLLAPNLEHALWAAAELSGGSSKLRNVILDDDQW